MKDQNLQEISVDLEIFRDEELTMQLLNCSANDSPDFIDKVAEIAKNSGYMKEQVVRLKIAAWFYNVGYTIQPSTGNFQFTNQALNYLKRMKIDPEKLTRFASNIEAYQVENLNYTEMVLHDAELANLIDTRKVNRNLLLRKVFTRKYGFNLSQLEWLQVIYTMISNRIFFTGYAGHKYGIEKTKIENDLLYIINSSKITS